MTLRYISVIALLFGAVLMVGTFGAPLGSSDVVEAGDTPVLELSPHPDSEGTYAHFDENDRFYVLLTEENDHILGEGVNPNAVTDVGNVLLVENIRDEGKNATVWIEHDGIGVEFYVPGHGTVESEADGITLQPGETMAVAIAIDTTDTDETILIERASIVATLDPATDVDDPTDPTPTPEPGAPDISITDVDLSPTELELGETTTASVTLENAGSAEGTETVELLVDGEVVNSTDATLGADETRVVDLEWTPEETGTFVVRVGGESFLVTVFDVDDPPTPDPDADIRVTQASISATDVLVDEDVTVTATVENLGEASGTETVELLADGTVVNSTNVTLDAEETETVALSTVFSEPGTYELSVGEHTFDVTVASQPEADIRVPSVAISETTVTVGDSVIVAPSLENVGNADGTHTTELLVRDADGEVVATTNETVLVPAGETVVPYLSHTFEEAGTYTLEIEGYTFDVTVESGPNIDVTVVGVNETTVAPGETVGATVDLENVGDQPGDHALELWVSDNDTDTLADNRTVELNPGENASEELTHTFEEAGEYTLQIEGETFDIVVEADDEETEEAEATTDPTDAATAEPDVSIVDVVVNETDIEVGESIETTVTLENEGDAAGEKTVELVVDDEVVAEDTVTVPAGGTTSTTLVYTFEEVGEYTVRVGDFEFDISVTPVSAAAINVTNVTLDETDIEVGESIETTVTLENEGTLDGERLVELEVDGEVVAEDNVTVPAGGQTQLQLSHTFEEAGEYEMRVDDFAFEVTVSEPFELAGLATSLLPFLLLLLALLFLAILAWRRRNTEESAV